MLEVRDGAVFGDVARQVQRPVEGSRGAFGEHDVALGRLDLAEPGDHQLAPLQTDFEVLLRHAGDLEHHAEGLPEVADLCLRRPRLRRTLPLDQALHAVANGEKLAKVVAGPECLEFHGPESSTGPNTTCYRRHVSRKPTVPALGAPTASGKSAVALELAERLGLEIVSADAMQVYRHMDVGTAKPTAAERTRVPHHGIDLVDPDASFSVADWVRHAESAIGDVLERGRRPFVVGGTGFYLQALARGLPTVPAADDAVQAEIWQELEQDGLAPLLEELREAAPEDAMRAQKNPRRVVRAVEILRRTGAPPSAFPFTEPAYRVALAVLLPDMTVLRPRIEARTERMFARGLVDEVRALQQRFPDATTANQAIGYKEVAEHLRGDATLDEAKAAVTLATSQYAKRQRTWFRKRSAAFRRPVLVDEARDELASWLERMLTES